MLQTSWVMAMDAAVDAYVGGQSLDGASRVNHLTQSHVKAEVIRRGLLRKTPVRNSRTGDRHHRWLEVDPTEIRARYEAGESELALATAFGVSRNVIGRRLKASGAIRRSFGEAQGARNGRLPEGLPTKLPTHSGLLRDAK